VIPDDRDEVEPVGDHVGIIEGFGPDGVEDHEVVGLEGGVVDSASILHRVWRM
jgi:hypothetical protein